MSFTAAIIGRPNVGKSTLFNRLTGKKLALVDDTPGLTRDRRHGKAYIGSLFFNIIDTAGLEKAETESLEKLMMMQTEAAVNEADVLFLMIDGKEGITAMDEHFALWLRKIGKPIILIVNKCESNKKSSGFVEAYKLGFGEPVAISAEHGQGMAELFTAIENLGFKTDEEADKSKNSEFLQIALVGRPNVGKSTMFNCLLGEERSIAAPLPGTTRDSVYVDYEFEKTRIQLVDTAGMRKQSKRTKVFTEKLSVEDSLKAIQYANVVILLIDATQPLDKQDLSIADLVINEGRGLVVAVNKWDLVKDKKETLRNINTKLEYSLAQAKGVPVVTISALTGDSVKKVIRIALKVFERWNLRISTGKLNNWLAKSLETHPTPLRGNRRIKLRYITQAKTRPPVFVIFSNSNIKDLPESYLRYLTNSIRTEFGFEGVPIRMHIKKAENPFDNEPVAK